MFYLFKNLLAAKDEEVWGQLIIVAIVIAFGILKAIGRKIKSMAEQKSGQSEYSPASAPAKPKKRYVAADGSYKTLEQLREERIAQIRAAFGIPEPPTEQQSVPAEAPLIAEKIEKPPAPEPQKVYAEPASPKIPAERKKVHVPASTPTEETVYKLLFSSPGDLRNAVLYQEILGKPLALRDSA
jgi:hypothetical protein